MDREEKGQHYSLHLRGSRIYRHKPININKSLEDDRMILTALALLAGSQLSGAAPTSDWQLEAGPVRCGVEQRLSDGRREMLLRLSPQAVRAGITVAVKVDPSEGKPKAILSIRAIGSAGGRDFAAAPRPQLPPSAIVLPNRENWASGNFPEALLPALIEAQSALIERDGAPPVTVPLSDLPAARQLLDRCMSDLLTTLGIDAATRAMIVEEPGFIGSPAEWFDGDRYPKLGSTGQFRAVLIGKISPEGQVAECRVALPSAIAEYDRLSCALLLEKGRFTPARGARGEVMTGYKVLPVNVVKY